jgi:hypothetical protein
VHLGTDPAADAFLWCPWSGQFLEAWNDHTDKLSWASGFLELLIRQPTTPILAAAERLLVNARTNHLRKLRGFYVDYVDGTVLLPAEITDAEAHQLISDVQGVLDVAKQGWCHDAVLDRIREARGGWLGESAGNPQPGRRHRS